MPDTTIYKKCEGCTARCCSDAVSPVHLKPSDVTRIGSGNLTGITEPASGNYTFRIKKRGDGKCLFYRENTSSHCAIYDKRPDNCRNYPVRNCTLRELE